MDALDILLTMARPDLDRYVALLKKWQQAVNLISPTTISDIWNRHIVDSAQLYTCLPERAEIVADMGSGAGFPGLVLAILNKADNRPNRQVILIESDMKKSLFLKEIIRNLNLNAVVLNQRIETVSGVAADVITARALAPLEQLLKWGKPLMKKEAVCLFLKGENCDSEIQNCPCKCQIEKIKSITKSNSYVLKITEVSND